MPSRPGGTAPRARTSTPAVAAVVGALVLIVAGCSSETGGSASPGAAASSTTVHSHPASGPTHDGVAVLAGTATGDSPCEQAMPTPASPGQVGTGEGGSSDGTGEHGARGMAAQQPLTRAERVELAAQMEEARQVAERYPTVKDAQAAGYTMSTVYVPCIGAHYTNTSLVGRFDALRPSELLYDGTAPDAEIVGLSYLVFNPGGPPVGFAGANDHWHQHNSNGGLCLKGSTVVAGEAASPEECAALGGRKSGDLMANIWMVHAWVVPGFECTWGVFSGECPELGGRLGGTAWDDAAQR